MVCLLGQEAQLARFSARPPSRLSRCRTVLPLLAGAGLVPPRAAEAALRGTCLGFSRPQWARCADSLSHLAKAAERAGFGDGHAACRARPVMSGRGSHAGWLPSRTSLSLPRFCATAALILGVASGAASLSVAWEASSSTLLTSRVPPALASSS